MDLLDLRLILMFSPLIVSFLTFYVSKFFFKHTRRAFHSTISWTTFLYIIVVTFLLQDVFSFELIGIMPIVLIIFLSIILIIQWKTRTEVILKNGLKILWRFSFLIFIPLYVGLIVYELLKIFVLT